MISRRGKMFYIRRAVPARYREVEPRGVIWVSLHTDSETLARNKAHRAWMQLVESWEARLAGQAGDGLARRAHALEICRRQGFRYIEMDEVARLPIDDLLTRVGAIGDIAGKPDRVEAQALLGAVKSPGLTLEDALELYWSLTRDKLIGKSEAQIRVWKNPRIKAVRNFISVVGNKPIASIVRDDMLDFRQRWLERIEAGEVEAVSANKDFVHLGQILKTVNAMKRLGLDLPLGDLSFREGEQRTRPPFSVAWIRERLLASRALDGLNAEARGLLVGMINTGYRPSEGAALTGSTIRLDTAIPHIAIEAEGRQLKTAYARRIIPLAGVSLDAFRAFPTGFERYRRRPSGLSATVNKYLREKGLLETPAHSFYSLRHSFEDRMLAAGIDDRIRRDLFGHRLDRERYGRGASLEHLARLIRDIAI